MWGEADLILWNLERNANSRQLAIDGKYPVDHFSGLQPPIRILKRLRGIWGFIHLLVFWSFSLSGVLRIALRHGCCPLLTDRILGVVAGPFPWDSACSFTLQGEKNFSRTDLLVGEQLLSLLRWRHQMHFEFRFAAGFHISSPDFPLQDSGFKNRNK